MTATLVDLLLERRSLAYDPWRDLSKRTGVHMTWHVGDVGRWKDPLAVTDFGNLIISIKLGMGESQLRSTLTHELVHLDRGPFGAEHENAEERRVDLAGAKRLIDPVLYDVLTDTTPDPSVRQVNAVLNVDWSLFAIYRSWRRRVKQATAVNAWVKARDPIAWPPRWLQDNPTASPRAARFAGLETVR